MSRALPEKVPGVPLAHGGIIPSFEVEDADAVYQQWKAQSLEVVGTGLSYRSFPSRSNTSSHLTCGRILNPGGQATMVIFLTRA
ncbi:MAG TPA: hypothetical protein VKV40_02270 [Ktedonobacteraceae bacterium]|nr:hypothetical protein [Ktedonobacteraceae bacterium]